MKLPAAFLLLGIGLLSSSGCSDDNGPGFRDDRQAEELPGRSADEEVDRSDSPSETGRLPEDVEDPAYFKDQFEQR